MTRSSAGDARTGAAGARQGRAPTIGRRLLLKLAAGAAAWWSLEPRAASAGEKYRVGFGRSSDPYAATLRAVTASGEWPTARIDGNSVIIKPNLVVGARADSGITTDHQVVRALVDLALRAGATRVLIVESGPRGAQFSACGYDFFEHYDPSGRVALVDLGEEPIELAEVASGLAYRGMYMPRLVLGNKSVFISVAKLKTHLWAAATLSMKNLFGLPPLTHYIASDAPLPYTRTAMHERGLHQTVADFCLVRPVDFAVVDGIWGMEGDGPTRGTPVEMNLVTAGLNAVAGDRACLGVMQIPQKLVQHLNYAALLGLGPLSLAEVEVRGDPVTPVAFRIPELPPVVWQPVAKPTPFAPEEQQETTIAYRLDDPAWSKVEIVATRESTPAVTHIRTLQDWTEQPAGLRTLAWDGRDDSGQVVPAGTYRPWVQTRFREAGISAFGVGLYYG